MTDSQPDRWWTLVYEGFDPAEEGLREALCTLGNGRFATRGAAIESDADGVHYPGTYLAGGYGRLTSRVAGREVENEDLVNLPNWLPLRVRPHDGEWLRPETAEVLDHRQTLDLRAGVLTRWTRLRDPRGRVTRIAERRLVSLADPYLAAIELEVLPENWSGHALIRSALDGGVTNAGVKRYRELDGRHLTEVEADHPAPDTARLRCRVKSSGLEIAQAARTRAVSGLAGATATPFAEGLAAGVDVEGVAGQGVAIRIEKIVALHAGRDPAIAGPGLAAAESVAEAPAFAGLLEAHALAMGQFWENVDIVVEGDGAGREAQMPLRLHLFHILQTLSPHTAEMDAGVPARGWHGEAYRGHVFWDEMFVLRVLNLSAPRLARALLRYRLRRLPEARRLAREAGLKGALYPWQSGSNGREETQTYHLNPQSGRWLPDVSHRQRHVGLAVAYNLWSYHCVTGDLEFLVEGGAEALVEIARCFADMAAFDAKLGRYRIKGVMGPDEYHTAYPGADPVTAGGVDDNAYTNVLTSWALTRAVDALALLPEDRRRHLQARLSLGPSEVERWQDVAERLHVPFLDDGVIAQFEGYGDLEPPDWGGWGVKRGETVRLDRLLEARGDDVNRYQVSKQADVLMLFFLFSAEELKMLFEGLGYPFDPGSIPRNVEFYLERTTHGSTLSRIVHAWVLARADRPRAWSLFREALMADLADSQGGTTQEGIHLGAMAGTVDMTHRGFTGLEPRSGTLHVNPALPEPLQRLRSKVRYRGQTLEFEVTRERLTIKARLGGAPSVDVAYRGRVRRLAPGTETTFRLVLPPSKRAVANPADEARPT